MIEPISRSRVTEFVYRHLLGRAEESPSFHLTPQGHLQVLAKKTLYLQRQSTVVRSHGLEWTSQYDRKEGGTANTEMSRFALVDGTGDLLFAKDDQGYFQILELERDCCYFAHPVLFAFESTVVWESGVVPSSPSRSWPLDRIAGSGTIVLRLPLGVMAIKISSGDPCRVGWKNFLGSVGNLVWTALPESNELLGNGDGAALVTANHDTRQGQGYSMSLQMELDKVVSTNLDTESVS